MSALANIGAVFALFFTLVLALVIIALKIAFFASLVVIAVWGAYFILQHAGVVGALTMIA